MLGLLYDLCTPPISEFFNFGDKRFSASLNSVMEAYALPSRRVSCQRRKARSPKLPSSLTCAMLKVRSLDPSSSLSITIPVSLRMFPRSSSRWSNAFEFSANLFLPLFQGLFARHVPCHPRSLEPH